MIDSTILVAFSGGLDTSYCVAWLKETTGAKVVTIAVDTGGFSAEELEAIPVRALEVGADEHVTVDGRKEAFDNVMRYCVQGNLLRGAVYPLCVSAERVTQATVMVREAKARGAEAIAHGSTGAGNDQVRFDVAIRTLAPELNILTPIRDQALSREEETSWLRERNIPVEDKTSTYSINAGMWGVTIGGAETHDPWAEIPEAAWPTVVAPEMAPSDGGELTLTWEQGLPVALNGESASGYELVEKLNALGAAHGFGRGIHTGDTILGIKGRIAFEAPAALMLVQAHRELEKLVLTRWQQFWKQQLSEFYGMGLHEALFFDPAMRDIEAMIESSQRNVTGETRIRLRQGSCDVTGVRSPNSLMDAAKATYGETQSLWSGRDAEGFTTIYGLQGRLAQQVESS